MDNILDAVEPAQAQAERMVPVVDIAGPIAPPRSKRRIQLLDLDEIEDQRPPDLSSIATFPKHPWVSCMAPRERVRASSPSIGPCTSHTAERI